MLIIYMMMMYISSISNYSITYDVLHASPHLALLFCIVFYLYKICVFFKNRFSIVWMATFLLVLRVLFGIFNIIPLNGKYLNLSSAIHSTRTVL